MDPQTNSDKEITINLNSPYIHKEHIVTINDQPYLMFNEFNYDFIIHGKKCIVTLCDDSITIKYLHSKMRLAGKGFTYDITIDIDGYVHTTADIIT